MGSISRVSPRVRASLARHQLQQLVIRLCANASGAGFVLSSNGTAIANNSRPCLPAGVAGPAACVKT